MWWRCPGIWLNPCEEEPPPYPNSSLRQLSVSPSVAEIPRFATFFLNYVSPNIPDSPSSCYSANIRLKTSRKLVDRAPPVRDNPNDKEALQHCLFSFYVLADLHPHQLSELCRILSKLATAGSRDFRTWNLKMRRSLADFQMGLELRVVTEWYGSVGGCEIFPFPGFFVVAWKCFRS